MKSLQSKISFFIFAGVIALSLLSCDGRPKNVLNKDDMTNILFEMHKLDGSLIAKNIYYVQNSEKEEYYKSILDKYNTTQADFDSSLIWYSKNPKKFEKIYETVYQQLTQLDEDIKKGKYHPVDSIEFFKIKTSVWNKATKYTFTKDSTRNKLNFEITNPGFLYGDIYVLKFLQRIAPEDSCDNQHIRLQINYKNGKVDSLIQKTYNDSLLRHYTIQLPAKRKLQIKSISGELLGSSAYKGKFNSLTDSITLIRQYQSNMQDSLRKMVQKVDPVIKKTSTKIKPDSLKKIKKLPPKLRNEVQKKLE